MGILRVYLALCVIACHSASVFPWAVQDGRQAVQIFFILSGFYMAMVLSGGKYPCVRDFYLSRFPRIYPPYFVVLGVTAAVFTFTGLAFHHWHTLSPFVTDPFARDGTPGVLAGTLSNLTLFGQDWSTFLAHDGTGPWRVSTDPDWPSHTVSHYCLVPQCWSVGVELTFYALAPFLNRLRTSVLLVLLTVSTSARLLIYQECFLTFDPWTHRFFPFEIALFLAGMLGYRFYTRLERPASASWKLRTRWQYALGVVGLLALFHQFATLTSTLGLFTDWYVAILVSYVGWACLIPVLFFVFGDLRADRIFGELS